MSQIFREIVLSVNAIDGRVFRLPLEWSANRYAKHIRPREVYGTTVSAGISDVEVQKLSDLKLIKLVLEIIPNIVEREAFELPLEIYFGSKLKVKVGKDFKNDFASVTEIESQLNLETRTTINRPLDQLRGVLAKGKEWLLGKEKKVEDLAGDTNLVVKAAHLLKQGKFETPDDEAESSYFTEEKSNIVIPIMFGRQTIGRNPDSNIMLEDLAVSRNHAWVINANKKVYLEDIGSSNGTYVNFVKLQRGQPVELKSGDRIKIGNTLLRFSFVAKRWN